MEKLTDEILNPEAREAEEKTRDRTFVLQYVQPGLAGLMDGSVSTPAPLFAAQVAPSAGARAYRGGFRPPIAIASCAVCHRAAVCYRAKVGVERVTFSWQSGR